MSETMPSAVLSDHVGDRLKGRRLVTALFTTFTFEPSFFEQEVLPVLFHYHFSKRLDTRTRQLGEALTTLPQRIAVYYDAQHLPRPSERRPPPSLDIARLPVRVNTGDFHPKLMLLLAEDDEGEVLLVSTSSANLTRSGWWENVEACHVEEVRAGAKCSFRGDLIKALRDLRKGVKSGLEHAALERVLTFLSGVDPFQPLTWNGKLQPQFYSWSTRQSVVEFIAEKTKSAVAGWNVEIISPFFDKHSARSPLRALCDTFDPKEVRVFMPRNESGQAECEHAFYQDVASVPKVRWATLPKQVTKSSAWEKHQSRSVHAKVIRFFKDRREVWFIGSANFTSAGHSAKGGNHECGFLIEVDVPRGSRPAFCLELDGEEPKAFAPPASESEEESDGDLSRLQLRFDWRTRTASALWDGDVMVPQAITLRAAGVEAGVLTGLTQEWRDLPASVAAAMAKSLPRSAFVEASADGYETVNLLVSEEGMELRPDDRLPLGVQDILEEWSMLSVEERIEKHNDSDRQQGDDEERERQILARPSTIFDAFAGVFHAFGCLKKRVRELVAEGKSVQARALLFADRYNSLPTLMKRVAESKLDAVDKLVRALCARQLLDELKAELDALVRECRKEWRSADAAVTALVTDARAALIAGNEPGMDLFVAWFETEFLKRAKSQEVDS